MSTASERDKLIANLDKAVNEVLAYFEGPGQTSKGRIGDWGAHEVLAHFLYWTEATARGMEQVKWGQGPFVVTWKTDAVNAASAKQHEGESFAELVRQARELQAALVAAARQLKDLDAVVLVRPQGSATARQRLETIASHWQGHVRDLQAKG